MKAITCLAVLVFLSAPLNAADEICARRIVTPGYPPLAAAVRVQGPVTLDLTIGADGKVISVNASGHTLLQKSAEENIRQWVFSPAESPQKSELRHLTITYVYAVAGSDFVNDPPNEGVIFELPTKVEIFFEPQVIAANESHFPVKRNRLLISRTYKTTPQTPPAAPPK